MTESKEARLLIREMPDAELSIVVENLEHDCDVMGAVFGEEATALTRRALTVVREYRHRLINTRRV